MTLQPGVYLWRSPHGYHYLRDHHGTLDVTPNHQRQRLAHQFQAHLADTTTADPDGSGDPEP